MSKLIQTLIIAYLIRYIIDRTANAATQISPSSAPSTTSITLPKEVNRVTSDVNNF